MWLRGLIEYANAMYEQVFGELMRVIAHNP